MAIIDRIKFDGLRSRDWLVYKHPSEQLVIGSQLIVNEGQVVIFVKGGKVGDIFTAGTHTLSSSNLPIIQGIINMPFGGKTPFTAEVYFINVTTKLDMHWGTVDPIQIVDPKYFVRLRVRAFGQFGLKISDYRVFFTELIGGMNQDDVIKFDKIVDYYKGVLVTKIKSIIADIIINNKISALEISAKLDDISEIAKDRIDTYFKDYGFSIINFFIQSINFPEEDFNNINNILVDKAAFEIMGDNRYSTKRSFDVYEGAANNENGVAGAFVAGGIGLGAGVALGSTMNNTVSAPGQKLEQMICPSCHSKIAAESKFCNSCGKSLNERVCYKCGTKNSDGSKFCSSCGTNLEDRTCECGAKLAEGSKFCNICGRKVEE
ncbi:MAG: hypothetical protein K0R15_1079 [Clostridiales bacterium]|jgi:membrane protease subunit (stomatin/prohibitin family)|nr:hypothetical protein [Clostridiales bacterium]